MEFKFIKRLVLKIIKSENFKKYSQIKSPNLEDCQISFINFFKDIIAPSSYLYNYLEDQNDIRMSFDDNNTASRRDFKLEQNEKSDALSNRIFERFEFD